jgi:hypothetical protein
MTAAINSMNEAERFRTNESKVLDISRSRYRSSSRARSSGYIGKFANASTIVPNGPSQTGYLAAEVLQVSYLNEAVMRRERLSRQKNKR